MEKYNHEKIESNWRDKWFEDNIYKAEDFSDKPKKYILAELPYPSGKSLHVGHMLRYTVPEIYSRFLRMQGYNVLFPMGWDAFGLPAETYAKKAGITPQEAINEAAKNYKESMKGMGYAIDWDREINTSDPDYYKWTQWTFKRLWEEGLAYQKEMPVWWCEELGVLADEEVLPNPDGEGKISERGGHKVERKMFKQWVLDIPAYAERLIQDLEKVDYEESVKQGQLNWIGKKEGALIDFEIDDESISVFTTRPDTIFGVTFLAIAPQHDLVEKLIEQAENTEEAREYIKKAKSLSDLEKQTKEKTGVLLKGITAKHPLDKVDREIPVFLADYILMDYGTGAIMGVPGHDERDKKFAEKYDLEIVKVINKDGLMENSGGYNGLSCEEFSNVIVEKLKAEQKGEVAKMYKLRPQVFSRQRYWGEPIPLIYKENGEIEALPDEELPLELPVMENFLPDETSVSPLARNEDWVNTTDSEGNPAKRETDTMPTWAGSNWYYLRYIDPDNSKEIADQEKADYWLPVDMYFGDAGHTTAHLLYSRFWFKFLYDIGAVPLDEPYNYRMSGGILLGPDGQKMSKSRGNIVNPQEVLEEYGADAVRTYLAFIGPYDETYPWNPRGLIACAKLVRDIYELRKKIVHDKSDDETITKLNQMLKNMTGMMKDLKMNTAVSEIMIFVNHLKKKEKFGEDVWTKLIRAIAPFMPFVAEELWHNLREDTEWDPENSIHLQNWPEYDEELAKEDEIELPIQINGTLRETITVKRDLNEEEIKKIVLENPKIKERIRGKEIKRFVYVPNNIVNIVV